MKVETLAQAREMGVIGAGPCLPHHLKLPLSPFPQVVRRRPGDLRTSMKDEKGWTRWWVASLPTGVLIISAVFSRIKTESPFQLT